MESKDIDPEIQDESMDLKNIDPDLVDFMMRNRPRVKPPPHIRAKLLEAALEQKKIKTQEKL